MLFEGFSYTVLCVLLFKMLTPCVSEGEGAKQMTSPYFQKLLHQNSHSESPNNTSSKQHKTISPESNIKIRSTHNEFNKNYMNKGHISRNLLSRRQANYENMSGYLENYELGSLKNFTKRKTNSDWDEEPGDINYSGNDLISLLSTISSLKRRGKNMIANKGDVELEGAGFDLTTPKSDFVLVKDDLPRNDDSRFNGGEDEQSKCFISKTSFMINDENDFGRYIVAVPLKELLELLVGRRNGINGKTSKKKPIPLIILDKGDPIVNTTDNPTNKNNLKLTRKDKLRGLKELKIDENRGFDISSDGSDEISELAESSLKQKIFRRYCGIIPSRNSDLNGGNLLDAADEKIKSSFKVSSTAGEKQMTEGNMTDSEMNHSNQAKTDDKKTLFRLKSKPMESMKNQSMVLSDTKGGLKMSVMQPTKVKLDESLRPVKQEPRRPISKILFRSNLSKKFINDDVGQKLSNSIASTTIRVTPCPMVSRKK